MERRAIPTLAAVRLRGYHAIHNPRLTPIRKELLKFFVHNRDNL